ncbi:outer membrane protein transport protein [bacterium]|nr:outer membrane protein transport protein [bacterium]MBU1064906.1 outer membrane protein transport protein [bacterium]MBU1634308.1 outer membrane protein transport protein [bacterium]MBU1874590.1 outer membrane protein transport protein [bacterium]
MKQRLLISTIILMIYSQGFGQSYFSPMVGDLPGSGESRQMALGFSGWGTSGSATALATNPALTGMSSRKVSVFIGINGYSVKEKRSFPVQDSFGDFLADNSYVVNNNWFPEFQFGVNYQLFSRLRLALLYQQKYQRNFIYEEEVRGSVFGQYNRDPLVGFHRIQNTGSDADISAGASIKLFKGIWLGAGITSIIPGNYTEKYEIEVRQESNILASDTTVSYTTEPEISSRIVPNFGVIAKVCKYITLSAAYRFASETEQEKGLIYPHFNEEELLPQNTVDGTSLVSSMSRDYPGELRLGLALRAKNIVPTRIFFEFVNQNWEDLEYRFTSTSDLKSTEVFNFRNIWKISVGVEHVFFSGIPFRVGFFHDPNPIDAGMDRNWFSAGTGYQWDNLTLEISGAFANTEYQYGDLFIPLTNEERVAYDTVREGYLVGMLILKYDF